MRAGAGLEEFCRAEWPRLVGALTAYVGSRQHAEDLASETIVRVVRDWRRVSRMDAPGAWTHRVAMNLAKDHFRRRGALHRARARGGEVHPHVHVDADGGDGVEVRRALAGLPPRQREAVVLRYVAELSLAEVATIMDITVGGVKSQIHAGLAAMRGALGDSSWHDSTLAADADVAIDVDAEPAQTGRLGGDGDVR